MIPIWAGIVSIGLVYAVVSRDAGLSMLEIQLMCIFVFSGAGQFAITALVDERASAIAIIGTVAMLNLRHILYGVSASRWLPKHDQPPRPILAHTLVDESYGIAEAEVNRGHASGWYLLGAGASLWLIWNLSVLCGLILTLLVDLPDSISLDFVFPLSFVALTVPLVRHRRHLAAALVAAGVTIAFSQITNSGLTVLAATISAIVVATMLEPA